MIRRWTGLAVATAVLTMLGAGAALAAPAGTSGEGAQPFVHPGVFVDRAQLAFVRAKLRTGAEPWASAFEQMRTSRYASLDWTPRPRANVECGSYSNPNLGCTEEREDAQAAYTHALLWYLTGDRRNAAKSIEIMNAWAQIIEDHTNSNAPLQAGWAAVSWTQSGELIRYSRAGWQPIDVARFAAMLRDVYLPIVLPGKPDYNGNWELIMEEAAAGIAVFLDDHQAFDQAIDKTRARVAAYIYLTSDGPLPNPPPGGTKNTPGKIIAYWQGQTTFVDGLAQETCRDLGHTGWGFDAAARTAETARIQGVDLYGRIQDRLVAAYEFHAAYELGEPVPSWLCGGTLSSTLEFAEVAYNHYHNRLGIDMPRTRALIETKFRPDGDGTDDHFVAWETLTNAENPVGRR
jgi:hypothetical protein